MSDWLHHFKRLSVHLGAGLLCVFAMTGCSVFQSSSHIVASEPAVSQQALASADSEFVAAPFSLVAADSVGLAAFGFEIGQWSDPEFIDTLAQQN